MNEEKKTGGRAAQKRGVIIAIIVMLAIVLIWYAVIPGIGAIIDLINKKKDDGEPKSDYMDHLASHLFYAADYDEDIYDDADYMKKDRSIAYTNGPDTYYISDGNFAPYGTPLVFFGRYFDTVINGRYQEYDEYFTDYYFENQTNKKSFTPQKMYGIKIELINTFEENGVRTYNYYVDFKIMKNNGTFRNDIGSDSARKVVYELIEDNDGTVLINYIGIGVRNAG